MEEVTNNKPLRELRPVMKLFVKYLGVASASIPAGILCYLMIRAGLSQDISLIISFCFAAILILIPYGFNYLTSVKSADGYDRYSLFVDYSRHEFACKVRTCEDTDIEPADLSDYELVMGYLSHEKNNSEYILAIVIRFYPLICEAIEELMPNYLKRVSFKNIFKDTDFLLEVYERIFLFINRTDIDVFYEHLKSEDMGDDWLRETIYRTAQRAVFEEMKKPHFSIKENFENNEIVDKPLDIRKIVSAIEQKY